MYWMESSVSLIVMFAYTETFLKQCLGVFVVSLQQL